MNKCPACGARLPDGQEFCGETTTMRDTDGQGPGRPKFVFLGCSKLGFKNLDLTTLARHVPGDYHARLTDDQRAIKVWGTDCILSEYGPLPNKPGTHGEGTRRREKNSAWAE